MEVQKNMCSNRPVVVGLAGVLPEGVNNLIWGFVGFQSKAAKAIEEVRGEFLKNEEEMEAITKRDGYTRTPGDFTEWLKHKAKFKLEYFVVRANFRLGKMRKMTERREAFTKLRPWLRRFLIRYDAFYGGLFSSNRKNQKFIEEQIEELGMRQEMLSRRQLRNRFRCSFDW